MKFTARIEHSSEAKRAFLSWLTNESTSSFQRAAGDPERLKAAAFLFANRAREASIEESEMAQVLGTSIARAALSPPDEEILMDCVETADQMARAVVASQSSRRPWWKFWV